MWVFGSDMSETSAPRQRHQAPAYTPQVFQAQLQEQALASYVWDLNDPGAPESTLLPSSQITALNFNLKARGSILPPSR